MKKPIKLHWASSKPNFGDWLSPLIVEAVSGRPVVHASPKDCDLLAIGSLLQRLKNRWWNRRVHVWGSGFIESRKPMHSRHYLHAIRGPLSAKMAGSDVAVFGDPGLLADRLLEGRPVVKKHRLSVIAHYRHKDAPDLKFLREKFPEIHVIDVFSDPVTVLEQIAASHFVLSSAMHGLIAADALSVPNCRMVFSAGLRGGDFKFNDYYAGIGLARHEVFDGLSDAMRLDERIATYSRPGIEQVKSALVEAFPEL